MTSERRLERLQKQILRSISQKVLFDAKDPRMMAMVTFTRVKLTKDVSQAKIYYSVLGDETQRRKIANSLDHMRGHLRTFLGGEMRVRSVPEIEFLYDDSVEKSIRLSETLRGINEEIEADQRRRGENDEDTPADGEHVEESLEEDEAPEEDEEETQA